MVGEERRRTPRVSISIPLQVNWTDSEGKVVEEQTHTEAFSNLGARIRLKNPIEVGQEIRIVNQQNQESMLGRLVWVSEDLDEKGRLVAFTFLTPSPDFWNTVAHGA
jgi:hypothetical protein